MQVAQQIAINTYCIQHLCRCGVASIVAYMFTGAWYTTRLTQDLLLHIERLHTCLYLSLEHAIYVYQFGKFREQP